MNRISPDAKFNYKIIIYQNQLEKLNLSLLSRTKRRGEKVCVKRIIDKPKHNNNNNNNYNKNNYNNNNNNNNNNNHNKKKVK